MEGFLSSSSSDLRDRLYSRECVPKTITRKYSVRNTESPAHSSFFEQYALSYNGLCWFLAVTLFLYVISYFLFKGIVRIRSTTAHMIVTLLTIIALNLMTRFGIPLYLYTNPIYRILDFWLGMLIAKTYTEKEHPLLIGTVIEVILVIVFLAQYLLSLFIGITPGYYSVLFAIAIYVFAAGKGVCIKNSFCRYFPKNLLLQF